MYKIPKLLKPPHKQSAEDQRIQEELRKSMQPNKEKTESKHQPEFTVEGDLDEQTLAQFLPMKQQLPPPQPKKVHYQPRNYLEEFFDQKGIIERQQKRKNMMMNALNHEIAKSENQIDQLTAQFQDYQGEINHIQEKVKQIERDGENLTLLQKLEILENDLNQAINLEIKEEFQLKPDDENVDDKLDLMYQDTQNLLDQYEFLKEQILEDEEKRQEDYEENQILNELDEKQQEDRRLQMELQQRIEKVKNEQVRLQMQKKLSTLKDDTLRRTEMKKASVKNFYSQSKKAEQKQTPKKKPNTEKQYNMYSQQFGYGKNKVTFKPL